MDIKNLLQLIPSNIDEEFFEAIVDTPELKIERIISRGHITPAEQWYDQPRAEWVLLIQGAASLSFENGETVSLTAGDHLLIPAHKKHRVSWTCSDQDSIWLAVHFSESSSVSNGKGTTAQIL